MKILCLMQSRQRHVALVVTPTAALQKGVGSNEYWVCNSAQVLHQKHASPNLGYIRVTQSLALHKAFYNRKTILNQNSMSQSGQYHMDSRLTERQIQQIGRPQRLKTANQKRFQGHEVFSKLELETCEASQGPKGHINSSCDYSFVGSHLCGFIVDCKYETPNTSITVLNGHQLIFKMPRKFFTKGLCS